MNREGTILAATVTAFVAGAIVGGALILGTVLVLVAGVVMLVLAAGIGYTLAQLARARATVRELEREARMAPRFVRPRVLGSPD